MTEQRIPAIVEIVTEVADRIESLAVTLRPDSHVRDALLDEVDNLRVAVTDAKGVFKLVTGPRKRVRVDNRQRQRPGPR